MGTAPEIRYVSVSWLVGTVLFLTATGLFLAFIPVLDCPPTVGMEVEEPPSGPPRPRVGPGASWLIPCPRCNGTGRITILRKTQPEPSLPAELEASPLWAGWGTKKTSWVLVGSAGDQGLAISAEYMLIDAGISMGKVDEQGRTLIYVPSTADREAALWALKKCALRGQDIAPKE